MISRQNNFQQILITVISVFTTLLSSCAMLSSSEKNIGWASNEGLYALIKRGDLALGMDQHQVERAWGRPSQVWTAGIPQSGNEKWIYTESPHFQHGVGRARVLYFESGQLAGWESNIPAESMRSSSSPSRRSSSDFTGDSGWY